MGLWSPAPLELRPEDDRCIPFLNQCYIVGANDAADPTMAWSSEVDMTGMREYLAARNQDSPVLLTPIAVLIRVVALSLVRCPELHRRLVASRVYRFTESNILLPVLREGGPQMALLPRCDELTYEQIATLLREEIVSATDRGSSGGWAERTFRFLPRFLRGVAFRTLVWVFNTFRLPLGPFSKHFIGSPVMVNHFNFACASPLIAYKPSRFGSRATLLNVTLGPTSPRPVARNGVVVVRPMSGLFVRADHRICDARQVSRFVTTVIKMLEDPAANDRTTDAVG